MSQHQFISLVLLDPVHGHPLQSWSFQELDRVRIGRTADNDVSIDSPQVSRLHVELVREAEVWHVRSHGRNGTLVGGRKMESGILREGDLLQLGPTGPKMEVRLGVVPNETAQATIVFESPAFTDFHVDSLAATAEADQVANGERLEAIRQEAEKVKKGRRQK